MLQILFTIVLILSHSRLILSKLNVSTIYFKVIHPYMIHTLLGKDYDSIKPDYFPVDLTIDLFISNFNSIVSNYQPDTQVFEARAQMILKWKDSRFKNILKIFSMIELYNRKMRHHYKVRIFDPIYPYTETISFHYDPAETPTLWTPFVFSENILNMTPMHGISPPGFISIRLDSTSGITYAVNVIIEFECETDPAFYPFDTLRCTLFFDSSEAINLNWGEVEIESVYEGSDKFILLEHTITLLSKNTLIPCTNQKIELTSQNSCLQLSFNIKRNVINFDFIFFIPIVTLMLIAYSSLYFSLSSYVFRILINTFIMTCLVNLYLIHPMLIYKTPLMASDSITTAEYLIFSAILYNLFILASTVVQVGYRSYQADLIKRVSKDKNESDETMIEQYEEKSVSPLTAFIEWFIIRMFFIFLYGQENTLLDLISRGVGIVALIIIAFYYRMIWIRGRDMSESIFW